MNQPSLNDQLDNASSKFKLYYIAVAFGILLAGLILVAALVGTNGTKLEVLPNDASQSAEIHVSDGFALYLSGSLYSLTSSPEITVMAEGYERKTEVIPHSSFGKIHQITLRELPGHLLVTTNPPDANTAWRLNGQMEAITEKLEKPLYAGDYQIEIDNPFYQLHSETVTITRQKETRLNVNLLPITGHLSIKSIPENATVTINGKEMGVTAFEQNVSGGEYRIQLSSPNHLPIDEMISITRQANQVQRNYKLELKKAFLTVDVSPKGGDLLLNGSKVEPESRLIVDAISQHQLSYHKDGYFSETRKVTLQPDQEETLTISLKPEIGIVEFNATPKADVYLKGQKIGTTPFQKKLPALSQQITFKREGYRSVTQTVKPQAKTIQKLNIRLQTELEARLAEAPKNYTNFAGVKLKLFLPKGDEFTMGAPRHEKGQRANEFQRKIKLEKPFYAGLYEVTNQQYEKFDTASNAHSASLPVTSKSWIEAAQFCNWLSQAEKLKPVYHIQGNRLISFDAEADGYRLLSEAEWEWLARKAARKAQTKFTWGDQLVIPPKAANIADETTKGKLPFYIPQYTDGYAGIAPIGSFDQEISGLYDQAGNVSEWIHDYYSLIPPKNGEIEIDLLGSQSGNIHTVKGANWKSGTLTDLRPAYRDGSQEGREDLGFRIGRYLYGGKL